MTPAAFIKEIAGPGRRPLYVLGGGDLAAAARCLKAAREATAPDFRDFNCQTPDLEAGQAGHLIGQARSRPWGPPPQMVTIKNPPFRAEDWNALADYLEAPNPETTILLVLENKLDASPRFSKKIEALGLKVDCQSPRGAALAKWLAGELKNRGVTAGAQVCELIIARAGEDLPTLLGEAEKLSLFLGGEQTLSAELVRSLISLTPDAKSYEPGDALGRHDLKNALHALLELLDTENPWTVLSMLTQHFLNMFKIKTRQDHLGRTRLGPEEAGPLGLKPYVLQKTQAQAAAWSWADLTRALAVLEEANLAWVSSGAPPPQILLENLALKLASLGQGRR